MKQNPHNDNLTTRIIPGLTAQYQIVSMPYWAWFWLEDFMKSNLISFQGIYDTFGNQGDINETLCNLAELHHDYTMREVYNLANDNEADNGDVIAHIHRKIEKKPARAVKMPKIYKLFGFIACPTTLEALWERRNYKKSIRVK